MTKPKLSFRGGGKWRQVLVCSKCGSEFAGVCRDEGTPERFFTDSPGYHKNQPGVKRIPYSEWKKLNV